MADNYYDLIALKLLNKFPKASVPEIAKLK